jgi:hypothetical protein
VKKSSAGSLILNLEITVETIRFNAFAGEISLFLVHHFSVLTFKRREGEKSPSTHPTRRTMFMGNFKEHRFGEVKVLEEKKEDHNRAQNSSPHNA